MWVTQLFPYMRIWVRSFYKDLYSNPATHFSIDPGDWPALFHCVDDSLIFTRRPHGAAIPVGGQLISVRHQDVTDKASLKNFETF